MANRRTPTLVGTVIACLLALLGIQDPAFAVTPGSVTPIINNVPGNASFSVHANATGWSKGTINVSVDLYVGPSSTGPWTHIGGIDNSCANSTSCSTSSGFHGPLSGTCSGNGAWYKAVGHASGPGGAAENNGAKVIKHIYGTLPAIAATGVGDSTSLAAAAAVPQECTIVYEAI